MRRKKILSFILVMAMTMSLLISSVAAATATIGTTTHQYTSSEPIYFKVQADVVYSQLNSSQMTITAMQSRIWNYSSSAGSLVRPVFKADTGTITHSTAFTGVYDLIEIPAGTSNYYTNCDWANLASRLGGSNTYPVPSTPSVTNKSLETLIGVYGDNFAGGLAFNYSAYWYGNGSVMIDDRVANTPYTRSLIVPITNGSASSFATYSIGLAENQESILDAESGEVSFALNVDSAESVQFATLPIIAADENFENCLNIGPDDFTFSGNTMYINTDCDIDCDTLYIRMPDLTVIDDNTEMLARNVDGMEVKDVMNEENGTRLLYLTYDSDAFSIVPNGATLLDESGDIRCISSMVFFDDDNNVIGGTFIFDVPVEYVCPNTFDLLLQGELVNVEGADVEVSVN